MNDLLVSPAQEALQEASFIVLPLNIERSRSDCLLTVDVRILFFQTLLHFITKPKH